MPDDGFSRLEVGKILLLEDDIVMDYRNIYLNRGVASLFNHSKKEANPKA
jgi:hypothetical protein